MFAFKKVNREGIGCNSHNAMCLGRFHLWQWVQSYLVVMVYPWIVLRKIVF